MKTESKRFLRVLSLLCVGALIAFCGCATKVYPKAIGDTQHDQQVSAALAKALGDDGLYDYKDVEVITRKGVTEMKGYVTSWEAIDHAESIARYTRGVHQLRNNLVEKDK
jgi:osmotically-inducible protein OsmY